MAAAAGVIKARCLTRGWSLLAGSAAGLADGWNLSPFLSPLLPSLSTIQYDSLAGENGSNPFASRGLYDVV